MSNLNLPQMTYDNLSSLLNGREKQIAYATTAYAHDGYVSVYHHSSLIAEIHRDEVILTNAGYESSTTTNRLQHILRDNQIPYSVRIKQFRNVLEKHLKDGTRVPRGEFPMPCSPARRMAGPSHDPFIWLCRAHHAGRWQYRAALLHARERCPPLPGRGDR